MFEIGFPELVLIAIVGLLVIGPERLPQALRTLGLWLGRMRRSFMAVKAEIEKEIGMDEVRRQLHNEAIMEEMKRIEAEVKSTAHAARSNLDEGVRAAGSSSPAPVIDPNAQGSVSDLIAAQSGETPPPRDKSTNVDAHQPDQSATADARDHSDAADDARDHADAARESQPVTTAQTSLKDAAKGN